MRYSAQPYSITMDAHGRVLACTTPGKTTTYAYGSYGRLTSKTITDTATAATRVTAYTYYANTTDPGGNVVLGRLKTVDGPRTDVADVTTYTYGSHLDLSKIPNALGQETNITARDATGRPTKIFPAQAGIYNPLHLRICQKMGEQSV